MTRILSCTHHPRLPVCVPCQLFNALESLSDAIDHRDGRLALGSGRRVIDIQLIEMDPADYRGIPTVKEFNG
jgi:hypothetical protein